MSFRAKRSAVEESRGNTSKFRDGMSRLARHNERKPEMFESLASCFAFRCSAPLNMTALF